MTSASHAVVYKGKTEILNQSLLLEELAERCGQPGAMHWLEHFFKVPTFRNKVPYLVVGSRVDGPPANPISWAVLLYEIAPGGVGLGIFSTDDISGFRTVIAPPDLRDAAVALAVDELLRRGGQIVMISFARPSSDAPLELPTVVPARWAMCESDVVNTLPARATYEETLQTLGKATRFNMRYYRRRLLRRMNLTFVRDARGVFPAEEIEAMNMGSLNPFSPHLARLQLESCNTLRGGFLMGLRTDDGRWLSLVGGWRQAGTTVLLWQMNRAGLERDSIGTVMRSYFVEHEVQRGATRILFYGGSPNSIEHSFEQDSVTHAVVVGKGWRARLLFALATLFAAPRPWMKNPNFLARTLHDPVLVWHETPPSP